jgi:hypothetical protein
MAGVSKLLLELKGVPEMTTVRCATPHYHSSGSFSGRSFPTPEVFPFLLVDLTVSRSRSWGGGLLKTFDKLWKFSLVALTDRVIMKDRFPSNDSFRFFFSLRTGSLPRGSRTFPLPITELPKSSFTRKKQTYYLKLVQILRLLFLYSILIQLLKYPHSKNEVGVKCFLLFILYIIIKR